MRDKDMRPNTYRRSREAVKRLNKEKNYNDWIEVADGFIEARTEALEKLGKTGSNKPTRRLGGGYNKVFGEILQREKLGTDVIDSTTRNQLFEIKDNISAIEAFRSELPQHERGKLNHPSTVLRHWKAWLRTEAKKNGQPTDNQSKRLSAAKRTSQELALALEENEQLKAQIAGLKVAAPDSKNSLTGYDAGQIVDLLLPLPKAKLNAVLHDLVKETKAAPTPQPSSDLVTLRAAYTAALFRKMATAKSKAEGKRMAKEEYATLQAALQASEPADPLPETEQAQH